MILKRIYLICLLLGTLLLFILSAFTLQAMSVNPYGLINTPAIANYYQLCTYLFFVILLILSNVIYFNIGKTIYLLISLVAFLIFLDFFWFFLEHDHNNMSHAYLKGAFFSIMAIFVVILNYYILRNYFRPAREKNKKHE